MGKKDEGGEQKIVRALAHPLRVEILRQLEEGPSSPVLLARRIGSELSNVSYHMKVLVEAECVELVETRPVRGALEHFYRLTPGGTSGAAVWMDIPSALRTKYAASSLTTFAERAIEAMDAGTMESREGSGFVWLPLRVDQEGWKELRRVIGRVVKSFQAVAEKSAARFEEAEDDFPVIVSVAAFEAPGEKDIDPS